ncbi:hypothetical protein RUND412_007675 [Rhizina undulata]
MVNQLRIPTAGPFQARLTVGFGGVPDKTTDVAVSAVFVAIFLALGAVHMAIFQKNRSRGHLFVFSAAIFGFCMSRIVTFAMQIAWAENLSNTRIAIAANIFISAGVIILYVVNLNFAQRIVRAFHPRIGNSKPMNMAFAAYYVSIVLVLIMVITTTVQSLNTPDMRTLEIDTKVRKFAIVWMTVFAFAPIPIILVARLIPSTSPPQNFGKKDGLNSKIIITIDAAILLSLSMSLRAATLFLPPRPITGPAWYTSRAAFYVFLPTLEILVVGMFAVARIDQRFFVDGEAERARAAAEKSKTGEEGA